MRRLGICLLALLLCLAFLLQTAALAEEGATASVLDAEEMQRLLDAYISEHHMNPDRVSIGYVYTETGETWYYNEDFWYYSASIYKVPLMMILAEKEYLGEITRDTKLKGLTLGEAEDLVLTHSHNDYAHLMMSVCADTEPECRELYKKWVDLPEDYYDPDFHDYSYFTARFMTQVMTTLYTQRERFPNIIESLLPAQPGQYFRVYLGDYQIAQKYGSFRDYSNRDFNHTTGIIFLPHPIILTVMTQDAPSPEGNIAELAKLFADYTLQQADVRYEEMKTQLEAQRLAAEAEAARLAERERAAAEQSAEPAVTEKPAPLQTPESTDPLPSEEPVENPGQNQQQAREEPIQLRLYVLGGAVLVLILAFLLRGRRR